MKLVITLQPTPESVISTDGNALSELLRGYGDLVSAHYLPSTGTALSPTAIQTPEDLARRKAHQLLKSIENERDPSRVLEVAQACQLLMSFGGR